MLWMSMFLFVILGVAALAVDKYLLYSFRMQQKNNADYCALFAVRDLMGRKFPTPIIPPNFTHDLGSPPTDTNSLEWKVYDFAKRNKYFGQSASALTAGGPRERLILEIGRWDIALRTFTVQSPAPFCTDTSPASTCWNNVNAVRITLTMDVDQGFAPILSRLLGMSTVRTTVQSIAYAEPAQMAAPGAPLNLLPTGNYAFRVES